LRASLSLGCCSQNPSIAEETACRWPVLLHSFVQHLLNRFIILYMEGIEAGGLDASKTPPAKPSIALGSLGSLCRSFGRFWSEVPVKFRVLDVVQDVPELLTDVQQ
jgi:hypothetical protein